MLIDVTIYEFHYSLRFILQQRYEKNSKKY